jgi:hypothetical protein
MSTVNGTYISENSLGTDLCNPLYNFPGLQNLRNATVYGDGRGYTTMWKCGGCGLFVPLMNCGRIGHAGDRGAIGACHGCGRGIGFGHQNNMVQVTAQEIAVITNLKVVADRRTFNIEPENTDKEWLTTIYSDEIKSIPLATFIQLFQYLLLSSLKPWGAARTSLKRDWIGKWTRTFSTFVDTIKRIRETCGRWSC